MSVEVGEEKVKEALAGVFAEVLLIDVLIALGRLAGSLLLMSVSVLYEGPSGVVETVPLCSLNFPPRSHVMCCGVILVLCIATPWCQFIGEDWAST